MKRWMLLSVSLFAADAEWSGTEYVRHKKMCEHFADKMEWGSHKPRQYASGSWGGKRAELAEKGVTFTSLYINDTVANVAGGEARGASSTGSFGWDLRLNFEKLANAPGWDFYTSYVWRLGKSLTATKIGNQFPVQQVFGTQTFELDVMYVGRFNKERTVDFRLGRLNACDYFLQSELYYQYVNNGFCGNPIAVFFNSSMSVYPHGTWGAYLYLQPDVKLAIKSAVFFANSRTNLSKFHGFNWVYNAQEKLLYQGEINFRLGYDDVKKGLPGRYMFGGWYQTGRFTKFITDNKKGPWGVYILLEQMIHRFCEGDLLTGVTPFLTLLFSPQSRTLFPFFMTTGIVTKGMLPNRPQDTFNVGVNYGKYGSTYNKQQVSQGLERQTHECDVEVNYRIQPNPWFFFQPTMQILIRPSGKASIPSALTFGFESQITW